MAALVFAFPPIRVAGAEWTQAQPVNVSRGLFGGRRLASSGAPARRVAALRTLSYVDDGAGYVECLKELLKGGEHLVRLYSLPVNHRGLALPDTERQSWPVAWRTAEGEPLAWRTAAGSALRWFTGRGGLSDNGPTILGTLLSSQMGLGRLLVTGLPPSAPVLRVGEFVAVYADGTPEGFAAPEVRRAVRPAVTDADGVATVWTVAPFTAGGPCNLGVADTGVFAVDGALPRAMRVKAADWPYDWAFREVFEEEVPGGFVERPDVWG